MKRTIHVLHITDRFRITGGHVLAHSILANMPNDRIHHTIVAFDHGPMEKKFKDAGVTTYVLPSSIDAVRFFVPQIKKIIMDFKFDIIHAHEFTSMYKLYPYCLERSEKPFFISEYGTVSKPDYWWETLKVLLNNKFTTIVPVTPSLSRKLLLHGISRKAIHLFKGGFAEGIDLSQFPILAPKAISNERKRWNIKEDEFVFSIIANMLHRKGFHILLEALAVLKNKKYKIKVAAKYGDEDPIYLKHILNLREKLKLEDVLLFGDKKSSINTINQMSDAFLLPTLIEGLPLSILEAMAVAQPVITTKVGSIPEVIKDGKNGLLVEPNSSKELAIAMQRIIEDAQLRHYIGAEGKKTVREKFDIHSFSTQWHELYLKSVS